VTQKGLITTIRWILFCGVVGALTPTASLAGDAPDSQRPEQQTQQPAADESEVLLWADDRVEQVSDYLGQGVNWFDGFFDTERYTDELNAKVHVRWRNEFVYSQSDDGFEYKPRVSARVDLPRFNDRVKLLISTDDDDELAEMEERGVVIPPDEVDDRNEVGVSYTLLEGLAEHLSLRGSLRVDPAELILKVRHRTSSDLGDELFGRLTTTGFYNTREGFGLKMKSDLELPLSELALLRWSNNGLWDEEHRDEGVKWSSQLTRYRKLSGQRAISYSAGVYGHSRPEMETDNYYIRARYRQNFLRPWLFLEVAPELFWPQDHRREECSTCFALLTRIEVVFRRWD
jgi:hypothetical protein